MTGHACVRPGGEAAEFHERQEAYGTGWSAGLAEDYDREYCVDLVHLAAFLRQTQPDVVEATDLGHDGPTRRKFLASPCLGNRASHNPMCAF
jgi:type I restriction enzyme, R subunit